MRELAPTIHAQPQQINREIVVILAMLRMDLGEMASYEIGESQEHGDDTVTSVELYGESGILKSRYYGGELKLKVSFIRGGDNTVAMDPGLSTYLRMEVPDRETLDRKILWLSGKLPALVKESSDTFFLRIEFPHASGLRPLVLSPF